MDSSFTVPALLSLIPVALLFWFFGPGSARRKETPALSEATAFMPTKDTTFCGTLRRYIPGEDGRALAYLIRKYGGRSNKNISGFEFYLGLGEGGTLLCFPPVESLYLRVDGLLVLAGGKHGYRVLEQGLWPKLRYVILKGKEVAAAEKKQENENARADIQAKLG